MAMADYYLCDICESKCFYDANLNWEWAERDNPIPEDEMVRGKHLRLGDCGDMAAICLDCAKTHEIRVVEIAAPQPVAQDGWIPVSERLPPWGYCLAFRPAAPSDNKIATIQYNPHVNGFSGQYPATHWMPLPAAPKGGE